MELINLLLGAGVDAKTAALVWFAVSYGNRLKVIENILTKGVCNGTSQSK